MELIVKIDYNIDDHFWVPRVYGISKEASKILIDGKIYVEENPVSDLNAIAKKKIVREIDITVTQYGIDVDYWCSNAEDLHAIASKVNQNSEIFDTEEAALERAKQMLAERKAYYG